MKTKAALPETVSQYIAACPKDVRARLTKLRAAIRKAAPKAEEKISYRIPAYMQDGVVIYFAAFKNHIGVYPRGSDAAEELDKYVAGKGTWQIPHDEPLPLAAIGKIVKARVKRNAKKKVGKGKKVAKGKQ